MTALRQAVLMSALCIVILYIGTEFSEEAIRWEFDEQIENDLRGRFEEIKADIETNGFQRAKYPETQRELVAYQGDDEHKMRYGPLGLFGQTGFFEDDHLREGNDEDGLFPDDWFFFADRARGYVLTVGVNLEQRAQFFSVIENTNFYLGLIAAAVMLVVGGLFGTFMQRRLWRMSMVLDSAADGNLAARIDTARPTDDLGALEQKIDSTIAQLELLMHQTRELSANIAHDLKTPLSQLRIRLESALVAYEDGEDCREDIAAALNRSDQIISIFEAFLRIANLEVGTVKARFNSVDLGELIEEVTNTYQPVIEDSDRTLVLRVDNAAVILGDRILLFQLFANLIENALHHTPVGTKITVVANQSELGVADDGPGIPEEERAKVTQPLYRLEKSRTSRGAGLGLAMVKTITHLHGAELILSNAIDDHGLFVRAHFGTGTETTDS